jgi:hypothetical protein
VSSRRRFVSRASAVLITILGLAVLLFPRQIRLSSRSITSTDAVRTLTQAGAQASLRQAQTPAIAAHRRPIASDLKGLPLSFEPNMGQADKRVSFVSHVAGTSILLSPGETVVTMQEAPPARFATGALGFMPARIPPTPPNRSERAVVTMKFLGANRNGKFEGLSRLPGVSNYYLGNDRRQWRTKVPTFAKVKYRSAYPGIDLLYYGSRRELEFDLIVAAGANPNAIKLGFDGTDKLEIDSQGNVIVHLGHRRLLLDKPSVYQEVDGARKRIEAKYVLLDGGLTSRRSLVRNVGIRVANYDRQRPLVVDPALSYSTYLGGTAADSANAVAIDNSDNNYITGFTCSTNFPTQAAEQSSPGGECDAFVSKFNSTGTALIYSTYLGGSALDEGFGIAVDSGGSAYVTGVTLSNNFPTTTGPGFGGLQNGFVTKLNADGSIAYSRYLGSSDQQTGVFDFTDSIALIPGCASDCDAYVTGETSSPNFPTTPGVFQPAKLTPYFSGFVTEVSSGGSTLVYSTYLAGSQVTSAGNGIAVDGNGDAYVTGFTVDSTFPVSSEPYQGHFAGTSDCFVSELNPTASALNYSTFLGGSGFDSCIAIALLPDCSSSCNAYVTGITYSTDFPTTEGAAQTTFGVGSGAFANGFVTGLSGNGSSLVYSSYLGGFAARSQGIALDASGDAYVAGITSSPDFPTVNPVQSAAGPNGIMSVSTNGGTTFTPLGLSSSAGSAESMAFDNTGAIYAATRTGVYKSTDEGASFSTTALTSPTLVLGFDPSSTTLYAGDPTGLVNSTDGGATFSSNLLPINATVFSIDVVPSSNGLSAIRRASALGPLVQSPIPSPSLSSLISKPQAPGTDPGNNDPPPAGAILDLSGTPIPGDGNDTYQQYTVDFTAAIANTAITFAFREDPAFISFSNASVVDLTTSSGNLLTNGDFSGGTYTDNGNSLTPIGWTYANQYGAEAGGVVSSDCGVGEDGSYGVGDCWYDGAVQAYDAISQTIATTPGDQYEISFWVADSSGCSTDTPYGLPCDFSDLSTNGDTTGTGGNGINVTVYAQAGLPPPATSTIYVGTNQGLFKSTNGGETFTQTILPGTGTSVFSVLVDPNNTSVVYAGTNKGLFESTDGGSTFSLTSYLFYTVVRALAADATTNPTTIYAGTNNAGVQTSTDFNSSSTTALVGQSIESLAVDTTTSPPAVYAGTDNGTLYESTDRGTTFNPTGLTGVTGQIIYTTALTAPNIYASEYLQDDATVTEFNSAGSALLFSTYLQGSNTDIASQVAVDPSGQVIHVVGLTGSSDFPVKPSPGAFQTTLAGNYDAFLTIYGSPIVTPTITPTPAPISTPAPTATPSKIPTPTPTPSSIPTPIPSTSSVGGSALPPPTPVNIAVGPGATVNSGSFTVKNTSGTPLVTPAAVISFNNADFFSSATLTAIAGPNTSTATLNPIIGGNSPQQPNNTTFVLQPPLVVPTGQTATYSLSVTVVANPAITMRNLPVMYAAMVGGRATGSNALLVALALLELCAAGISTTRRRRLLMALLLLLALASQVGCDNGSVPSPPPAITGVIYSTQTAMELEAMKQVNNIPVKIAGLPIVMGTVSCPNTYVQCH